MKQIIILVNLLVTQALFAAEFCSGVNQAIYHTPLTVSSEQVAYSDLQMDGEEAVITDPIKGMNPLGIPMINSYAKIDRIDTDREDLRGGVYEYRKTKAGERGILRKKEFRFSQDFETRLVYGVYRDYIVTETTHPRDSIEMIFTEGYLCEPQSH